MGFRRESKPLIHLCPRKGRMKPLYSEGEFKKARSRQRLPLQCRHCEKPFLVPKHQILHALNPSHSNTGDFCSHKCQRLHENPPIIVQCVQCQRDFKKLPNQIKRSPRHFCSCSCAAKYHNTHKTTGTRVSKLERWLQVQLPTLYPGVEFHFNRKDAINSELDIYIPSLRLAFELNGIFHYEPIYGPKTLANVQNNDQRKFQACLEQGIELCLIDVSRMVNFKEQGAAKFLEIIRGLIDKVTVRTAAGLTRIELASTT
jgi:hypothetical protein